MYEHKSNFMLSEYQLTLMQRNYDEINENDFDSLYDLINSVDSVNYWEIHNIKKLTKIGYFVAKEKNDLSLFLKLISFNETGIRKCERMLNQNHMDNSNFQVLLSHINSYCAHCCKEVYLRFGNNLPVDYATKSYTHYINCIDNCIESDIHYKKRNIFWAIELTKNMYRESNDVSWIVKCHDVSSKLIELPKPNKNSFLDLVNISLMIFKKKNRTNYWAEKAIEYSFFENNHMSNKEKFGVFNQLFELTNDTFWLEKKIRKLDSLGKFNIWHHKQAVKTSYLLFNQTNNNLWLENQLNYISFIIENSNNTDILFFSKLALNNCRILYEESNNIDFLKQKLDYLEVIINNSDSLDYYEQFQRISKQVFKQTKSQEDLILNYKKSISAALVNRNSKYYKFASKTASKLYGLTNDTMWLEKACSYSINAANTSRNSINIAENYFFAAIYAEKLGKTNNVFYQKMSINCLNRIMNIRGNNTNLKKTKNKARKNLWFVTQRLGWTST